MFPDPIDYQTLVHYLVGQKKIPKYLSIYLPRIPKESDPIETVFSQLEKVVENVICEPGDNHEYRLRLDLQSHKRFCSVIPAELKTGQNKRKYLEKKADERIRSKGLCIGNVEVLEKDKTDRRGNKYRIINISFFRPAELSQRE